jgi:hypothetical protein
METGVTSEGDNGVVNSGSTDASAERDERERK